MIVFSILDRLVEQTPSERMASGSVPEARLRGADRGALVTKAEFAAYRTTVRRDLEWLLNTRRIAVPLPEGLREVERSVYFYGLPDFTQMSLSPGRNLADQERLASMIARTIEMFEPRILNPQVRVDTRAAKSDLHFTISGKLKMKPRPEPVAYDTTLDATRGEYAVSVPGEARA